MSSGLITDGHYEAGRVGSNKNQKARPALRPLHQGLNSGPGPLGPPLHAWVSI